MCPPAFTFGEKVMGGCKAIIDTGTTFLSIAADEFDKVCEFAVLTPAFPPIVYQCTTQCSMHSAPQCSMHSHQPWIETKM
jgi:hypothetical protein